MKITKNRLIQIIKNAIFEFEYSEYEHQAILEYLDIDEEEYQYIKEFELWILKEKLKNKKLLNT